MEANSNENSEELKISIDWNQNPDSVQDKFSHITESDLKLEKDKEEQWNKSNEIRLHVKWEEVTRSIKNLFPVTL